MADSEGNQEYLGIDSSVLIAYLVPEHPLHKTAKSLTTENHAVNATVMHETYLTAVFKLRRRPEQTVKTLLNYMRLAMCLPLSEKTVELGLRLASSHGLGGRDALILASYLDSKTVRRFVTMDSALLRLKKVMLGKKILSISRP